MTSVPLRVQSIATTRGRSNFAAIHFSAARHFASQATATEQAAPPTKTRHAPPEYIHFWSGAIVFSVMAAEADLFDLMSHADRYEGSAAMDLNFTEADYWQGVLERYSIVHARRLGHKLETGSGSAQAFKVLVTLRNEVVHSKSEWRDEAETSERLRACCGNRFSFNPYAAGEVFFPDQCISAAAANWAVATTERFIKDFSNAVRARPSI